MVKYNNEVDKFVAISSQNPLVTQFHTLIHVNTKGLYQNFPQLSIKQKFAKILLDPSPYTVDDWPTWEAAGSPQPTCLRNPRKCQEKDNLQICKNLFAKIISSYL